MFLELWGFLYLLYTDRLNETVVFTNFKFCGQGISHKITRYNRTILMNLQEADIDKIVYCETYLKSEFDEIKMPHTIMNTHASTCKIPSVKLDCAHVL